MYYYKRCNDFSYHIISIAGDDPRRSLFVVDAIIEVWRRNPVAGIPWYLEYEGFHRTNQDQITDRGNQIFTSYGRGFEDLLHRRTILYPAGSNGSTKVGALDNVMKAYVRENAGVSALAINGRLRDGVTPGFLVSVDSGLGHAWSGSQAWKNLLSALQDMTKDSPQDFFVTRVLPTTFRFDTAFPRRGFDRTGASSYAPAVFSLTHDNMSAPFGVVSRTDEVNVAIVLGAGEGANRLYAVRTDPFAIAESPWNSAERTIDQRNDNSIAALNVTGDDALGEGRATRHISFVGLDTPGLAYARDFALGDLVIAQFRDLASAIKLVGVECTVSQGREDLRFHFEEEP